MYYVNIDKEVQVSSAGLLLISIQFKFIYTYQNHLPCRKRACPSGIFRFYLSLAEKNALRSFWARYRASFITKSTQNVINKFSVCGFVAMTSERGQTTTVNFLNVVKAWENNVLHQNVNAQLCILHM